MSDVPAGYEADDDGRYQSMIGPMYSRQLDDESWHFRFTVEERHLNGGDVVHGGMLMSFADHILGKTVWKGTGETPCTTMSMNCDFVAAGKLGAVLEGTARITRKTRSIIFVQGEITSEGKTLMTATGLWKILGVQ